jgi:hypothetical protein
MAEKSGFEALKTGSELLNQRLSRACIVHLVIKKTNWSYVKTMSCSGSHLGITINIKNTKFVKDLHRLALDSMGKYSNAFFSETTNMIKTKLYMNVHWMILYKLYVFCSDMKFKMAAMAGLV